MFVIRTIAFIICIKLTSSKELAYFNLDQYEKGHNDDDFDGDTKDTRKEVFTLNPFLFKPNEEDRYPKVNYKNGIRIRNMLRDPNSYDKDNFDKFTKQLYDPRLLQEYSAKYPYQRDSHKDVTRVVYAPNYKQQLFQDGRNDDSPLYALYLTLPDASDLENGIGSNNRYQDLSQNLEYDNEPHGQYGSRYIDRSLQQYLLGNKDYNTLPYQEYQTSNDGESKYEYVSVPRLYESYQPKRYVGRLKYQHPEYYNPIYIYRRSGRQQYPDQLRRDQEYDRLLSTLYNPYGPEQRPDELPFVEEYEPLQEKNVLQGEGQVADGDDDDQSLISPENFGDSKSSEHADNFKINTNDLERLLRQAKIRRRRTGKRRPHIVFEYDPYKDGETLGRRKRRRRTKDIRVKDLAKFKKLREIYNEIRRHGKGDVSNARLICKLIKSDSEKDARKHFVPGLREEIYYSSGHYNYDFICRLVNVKSEGEQKPCQNGKGELPAVEESTTDDDYEEVTTKRPIGGNQDENEEISHRNPGDSSVVIEVESNDKK